MLSQAILERARTTRLAITHEPFLDALACGELPDEALARWTREDVFFLRALRRTLGLLIAGAPDEPAVELLAGAYPPLGDELRRFEAQADRLGVALAGEPHPLTARFNAHLRAAAESGFEVGVAAYWAGEAAYLEAWSQVRARIGVRGPHAAWIENWTGEPFAAFVAALGRLVDRLADPVRGAAVAIEVFDYERRFWRLCFDGADAG